LLDRVLDSLITHRMEKPLQEGFISMKLSFLLVMSTWLLATFQAGCGVNEESTQVKMNAVTSDENNSVVRVRDGESAFFVYVTVNRQTAVKKGFRIECETMPKLLRLIASTGFPTELLNTTPIHAVDSQEILDLKLDEQPRLNCSNPDKVFFKIAFADKTRYFFTDTNKSRTRLYNVGCQKLVDSMGFNIDTATPVSPEFITDLKIFSADDADDISCIGGFEIGAKLAWTSPAVNTLILKKMQRLPLSTYAASKADGTAATLSLSREGRCDWVESSLVNGALFIAGQTPYDFQGQVSCILVVTADAGSPRSESITLQIFASPLPVESNGWIRDAKSDTGVGGALGEAGDGVCNGLEECVYQDTRGRHWSKMDSIQRNYDEAMAHCFALEYGGYSDWRLPTVDEVKQAAQDRIHDLREPAKLDLYTYSWAINALAGDATKAYYVNLNLGIERPLIKSKVMKHTCTRQ